MHAGCRRPGQVWKKARGLWYGAEKFSGFAQAAWTLEEFGDSNAIWHLLKLECPFSTFYWVLKNNEEGGKLRERQAMEKWQRQIEVREGAPLNSLKGQPKGEATKKLAWRFKLDPCFMSKTLKKEGPSFCNCARKSWNTHCIVTLPQQWQQQRAPCWMLSWKLVPQNGSWFSAH